MQERFLTYLLLTVFCCCSLQGTAQELDKQRIDSLILKTDRTGKPGFAVRILKNNQVIYEGQCGFANIAKKKPMNASSVVNIASVTKQFTAYSIFLLEERGSLNTSDEIHKYLPELPDFGAPVTLNQLLGHTSGLRDYPDLLSLMNQATNRNLQYNELVKFLQTHRELNFQPGESFCYSNTGYMLLARVIEQVSGTSFSAFLQKEVFGPLGMTSTFVNEGILNEQTDGTTNYTLHRCKTKFKKSRAHRDVIGATGIFSNLEDLTKWNRLFYEHESRLNRSSVIARMETAFTLNDGSSTHYGGGLLLKHYRGKPVIEHSGGWGEYLTQLRRFPQEGITIMVATNSLLDSPIDICDRLSNLLVSFNDSALPELAGAPVSLKELDGTYISEDNIVRHVVTDSLHSRLKVYNLTKSVYCNYSLDRIETLADQRTGLFFVDSVNNQLVLATGKDGVTQLIWNMGTYFETKRTYSEIAKFRIIDDSYAGKYYVPEMQRTVRVVYNPFFHRLVFIPFPFIRYKLTPIGDSVYQMEGETYLLRFTNSAILFGNDWIFNIGFEKNTSASPKHSFGVVF